MEAQEWGSSADGVVVTLVADDDLVITIVGELDAHGAPMLTEALTCAEDLDRPGVRLDVGECTFIDSSGLSALVRGHKTFHEQGKSFTLAPVSEPVARVLKVSGLGPHLMPAENR